jgi:hypothetical protein
MRGWPCDRWTASPRFAMADSARPAGQRGSALLVGVIVLAVLVVLSAVLLEATRTRSAAVLDDLAAQHALDAADTGVALKCHEIELTGNAAGARYSIPSGEGPPMTVNVTVTALAPGVFHLRSQADYVDPTGRAASRRLEVIVGSRAGAGGGLFGGGFRSSNLLTMSGGSSADSYDSSAGAYNELRPGSDAMLTANGKVTLSGPVLGNVVLGPSGTVNDSSGVSGSVVSGPAETFDYPPLDLTGPMASNLDATVSPSTAYNGGSKALSMSGGGTITLGPGVYYFSAVTLSGGSKIVLSGAVDPAHPVEIYVSGKFSCSGGGIINPTQIPSALRLYAAGPQDVTLSGGSGFYGLVHAPNSKVTISGGGDFYGAINAHDLVNSGGTTLHYDIAAANVGSGGGALLLGVQAWREARD